MTPIPRSALMARVADWHARGLIDGATAGRLQTDIGEGEAGGFGFQRFVVIAGILCLAFAAITFVASNWEQIPRVIRLAMILAALWASWGGGVWAARAGRPVLAEGLWFLACVIYGAGLALVAQLYHIQGEAPEFVLAWALGTLIGAALVRAHLALVLGVVLITIWHAFQVEAGLGDVWAQINPAFLGLWAIAAGLCWWFGGALVANALALSLLVWWVTAVDALLPSGTEAFVTYMSFLALLAVALWAHARPAMRGIAVVAMHYLVVLVIGVAMVEYVAWDTFAQAGAQNVEWIAAFVALVIALGLAAQLQARGAAEAYELWVTAAAVVLGVVAFLLLLAPPWKAAYLLALSIWVARMGYRTELRLIRFIGMAAFLLALMLVYGETVGTLIGTAGFYLGAGLVLLGGAWVSTRLHRAGPEISA